MHAGDIFPGKNLPLLDTNNGGSGARDPRFAEEGGRRRVKNIDTIITGHSTTMTVKDLVEYADFNRDFMGAMRDAKKAGKSVADTASAWKIAPKYTGYTIDPGRLKTNVQVLFDELK